MGGLQVRPTISLNEIKIEEVELLILPGGVAWEKREITMVKETLPETNVLSGEYLSKMVKETMIMVGMLTLETIRKLYMLLKEMCLLLLDLVGFSGMKRITGGIFQLI